MDTKHLYYAVQVAEYRSISKAADALYLSQPTLSGHINKLESQLGCKLFDRNTIPLKLTYEGECFMEYALQMLELEKNLIHKMQSSKNAASGRITIGIPPCYSATLLPQVLPAFKAQYPQIELQLVEESSTTIETLLEKEIIDLGILNLPVHNHQLLYETLLIDHVILAIPNAFLSPKLITSYPLTSSHLLESVDLKDFKDFPFLLLKPGHRVEFISRKILETENITPNIYIQSSSIDTLCEFCLLGHGITFVPRHIAYKKFNVPNIPVSLFDLQGHHTDYSMVALYNKKFPLTLAMKSFIHTIRTCQQYAYST